MKVTKNKDGEFRRFRWQQRGGEHIALRNMGDNHLVNTARGVMRRLSAREVAWHYWFYALSSDLVFFERHAFIYHNGIREIMHRSEDKFGERTQKMYLALTAIRMECDFRDIDWWDHLNQCDCGPCMAKKQEGAKYYEKNPNYQPMK
jgi:hypothetical protein